MMALNGGKNTGRYHKVFIIYMYYADKPQTFSIFTIINIKKIVISEV